MLPYLYCKRSIATSIDGDQNSNFKFNRSFNDYACAFLSFKSTSHCVFSVSMHPSNQSGNKTRNIGRFLYKYIAFRHRHSSLNFMIMTIPTAVKEHTLALLRILRAHGLGEICTLNGNVERRNLLKVNDLLSGHLTRLINKCQGKKPVIAPS